MSQWTRILDRDGGGARLVSVNPGRSDICRRGFNAAARSLLERRIGDLSI